MLVMREEFYKIGDSMVCDITRYDVISFTINRVRHAFMYKNIIYHDREKINFSGGIVYNINLCEFSDLALTDGSTVHLERNINRQIILINDCKYYLE